MSAQDQWFLLNILCTNTLRLHLRRALFDKLTRALQYCFAPGRSIDKNIHCYLLRTRDRSCPFFDDSTLFCCHSKKLCQGTLRRATEFRQILCALGGWS